MELTHKQEEAFKEWYLQTYKDDMKMGEDGRWELPIIYSSNPKLESEVHHQMWADKLTELLGPRKAKQVYKDRGTWKQTYLDYALGWLWLGYGPTFRKC